MKLLKRIAIIICILLVVGGELLYYFNAHKYNQGRVTLSVLMIGFGSLILFMMLFWRWLDDNLDADYNVNRRRWLPFHYKKPLAYTIFLAFFATNFLGLPKLATSRRDRILRNEETREAIATVTELKVVKQRKHADIHLAIIQYQTASGIVTQSINDECNCHYTGQPIRIVYAVDYPEMFYGIR